MDTINNNSRIMLYLSGLMDRDEAASFEKEMASNPELKSEVYLYRTAQLKQFIDLKNKFKAEYAQNPVVVPIRSVWQPIRIAASILLFALIGAGAWFGINKYQAIQEAKLREQARLDSLRKIENQNKPQLALTSSVSELISLNIADSKQPLSNVPSELDGFVKDYQRAENKEASIPIKTVIATPLFMGVAMLNC